MPPAMTQTPMDVIDQLNAPVLDLFGAADQDIPLDLVERMRGGILAFSKKSEIRVYDGIPHACHANYLARKQQKAGGSACWHGSRSMAWPSVACSMGR